MNKWEEGDLDDPFLNGFLATLAAHSSAGDGVIFGRKMVLVKPTFPHAVILI